jgi:hypothetical protein
LDPTIPDLLGGTEESHENYQVGELISEPAPTQKEMEMLPTRQLLRRCQQLDNAAPNGRMNDEFEWISNEAALAFSMHYPGINLEGPRKNKKTLHSG